MPREIVLSAIYRKEATGYSALCPELGVASQGETIEEAESNLKEACEVHLESANELGILKKLLQEANLDVIPHRSNQSFAARLNHSCQSG